MALCRGAGDDAAADPATPAGVAASTRTAGGGQAETAGATASRAPAAGCGPEWGTAVHRALEAAARGAAGETLRAACRGFLLDAGRPVRPDGEPEDRKSVV